MKIPFSPPDIGEEEISEVADTLRSGWITTGPKTKKFEKEIAEFCGTAKVVCLNSATASLEMTLRILGIGEGDEVIVPAYTYTASASVICHVGAKPVIVDCAKGKLHLDAEALAKAITDKTKVVIPVDVGGAMCDYDSIFKVLETKKSLFKPKNKIQEGFGRIIVLADGAHSFGAEYKNQKSGSVADFTAFSFHAVKNLTTAEGGAVIWRDRDFIDNDELYKQYMLLSLHGQNKDALAKTRAGAWEYDIVAPYFKCNMTDIMASIGLVQLKRYPSMLKRRKEIIKYYNSQLDKLGIDYLKHYTKNGTSSGHLYISWLTGHDSEFRNNVISKMAEMGVATNVHYKPLPLLTAYKNLGFDIKDYPNAFELYQNEVTLPLYSTLTNEQMEYVISALSECIKA